MKNGIPAGDFVYKGPDPSQYAQRKARYGHRDWIVWTDKTGQRCAARATPDTVKMALLANGTQGDDMVYVHANCGSRQWLDWNTGLRILRNFRHFN